MGTEPERRSDNVELRDYLVDHWQHLDGSPCPIFMAPRPTPEGHDNWWCTEHQQRLVWKPPDNDVPRQEYERLRDATDAIHRDLMAFTARLYGSIESAVQQLRSEHQPAPAPEVGPRGGCVMCWPKDGSWPCVSRMVADELAASGRRPE